MIEARVDTIMRGVEYIGGGLYPAEIAKLKKRVRKGKRVCKGEGCITRISAYNRDKRGHPETLCYKCRSKATAENPQALDTSEITEEYAQDEEDVRRRNVCPKNHDIDEVGRYSNYRCRQCARDEERARDKASAEAAGRTYVALDSRIALNNLARLMEERGITCNDLAKKTGIDPSTLRGYAKIGGPRGYRCPPEKAELIADSFRLDSVEELSEAPGEVE